MSFPNIPDINPNINIDREDAINILIASIGVEELALAHILNAEGEKIQYVLGTLEGTSPPEEVTLDNVLSINKSVIKTLREVIKAEILLHTKLENAVDLLPPTPTPKPQYFTVSYFPEHGIGHLHIDNGIPAGTLYIVKTPAQVGLSIPPAKTFEGWITGDGNILYPGDTIIINRNETLTAKLED